MKLTLLLCSLWIGTLHAAHAQSLDIGGIELRIGQNVDEALESLSAYNVQWNKDHWFVTQGLGKGLKLLGTFSSQEKHITFISKSFWIKNSGDAPEVYTRASEEIRRRGGDSCITREFKNNGIISSFITQCGPYELTYTMPWHSKEGTPVNGGVHISVSK